MLVIEDDPHFSNIIKTIAKDQGFEVHVARDGRSGLHLAQQHKPTAIILDVSLPDIRGNEVLSRLKNNPETSHIPVQVISGKAGPEEVMQTGAFGYLAKPAEQDRIISAIQCMEIETKTKVKKVLLIEDDLIIPVEVMSADKLADLMAQQDVVISS